jgi:hypothetical protein
MCDFAWRTSAIHDPDIDVGLFSSKIASKPFGSVEEHPPDSQTIKNSDDALAPK